MRVTALGSQSRPKKCRKSYFWSQLFRSVLIFPNNINHRECSLDYIGHSYQVILLFKTYILNYRQITTENGNSQISKGNNSLPSQDATVHIFVQLEEQNMITRLS